MEITWVSYDVISGIGVREPLRVLAISNGNGSKFLWYVFWCEGMILTIEAFGGYVISFIAHLTYMNFIHIVGSERIICTLNSCILLIWFP